MSEEVTVASQEEYIVGQQYEIAIDKIVTNPNQPRTLFDDDDIQALAKSIERDGLINAIAVTPVDDGKFRLIAGERRFRAYKSLGRETIPARIVQGDEQNLALIENILRAELTPLERAIAMEQYQSRNKLTKTNLAINLGFSKSSVSEILSLNKLPKEMQEEILKSKKYPLRRLKTIAKEKDINAQKIAFNKLKAKIEKISVSDPGIKKQEKYIFTEDKVEKRLDRITAEINKWIECDNCNMNHLKIKIKKLQSVIEEFSSKISE